MAGLPAAAAAVIHVAWPRASIAGDPAGQVRRCCAGHGEPEIDRPVMSGGQRRGDLHGLVVGGAMGPPLRSPVEHPPPHRTGGQVGVPAHEDCPSCTGNCQSRVGRQHGGQRRRPGAEAARECRRPIVGAKRPAPRAAGPGVRDHPEPGLVADPGRDQHRVGRRDHRGAVVDGQNATRQIRSQIDLRPPADPAKRLSVRPGHRRVLRIPGETGPLHRSPMAAALRMTGLGDPRARCRGPQQETERDRCRGNRAGAPSGDWSGRAAHQAAPRIP